MPTYGEAPKGANLIAQLYARKVGRYTFELHPELWAIPDIADYYDPRPWQIIRFTNPPEFDIPVASGIYMFVVAPHCGRLQDHSYIFYVGRTKDLRRRYANYLEEQAGLRQSNRPDVIIFLNHLRDYVFFHYTLIPENELEIAENLLKDNLTPPANSRMEVTGRLNPPIEP